MDKKQKKANRIIAKHLRKRLKDFRKDMPTFDETNYEKFHHQLVAMIPIALVINDLELVTEIFREVDLNYCFKLNRIIHEEDD